MAPSAADATSPGFKAQLSYNDASVLAHIADPESAASSSSQIRLDASLPSYASLYPALLQTQIHAIRCVQANDFATALSILETLIDENPRYAPAYNDRAQILRILNEALKGGEGMDNLLLSSSLWKAYTDLSTVVRLVSPATPSTAISPKSAKLLEGACVQRASLLHATSKYISKLPAGLEELVDKLPADLKSLGTDVSSWEEAASRDFFKAGMLGNEGARKMAAITNPTAKLCGAIVKEAMRKEFDVYEGRA